MRIAATTQNGGLQDTIIPQFGRAPTFTIVEVEGDKIKSVEVVENRAAQQLSGAGISAAQTVIDKGVQVVLTGNVGPKAMSVLSSAKIRIYSAAGLTVEEAVKKLIAGELNEITTPSGGMGRGMGRGMGGGRWR